ncbi:melatonin receptor type 1B-B-like [Patiria miniata]|uniref:G-protein coupled receptors family 1 profile domain-containing protein n=1 Tax=Patiria miniata TaxID=46514 RepID=A0A913Z086_PATMI|nr:melatonin receptor type 1B-B-like [Patiria miniata]
MCNLYVMSNSTDKDLGSSVNTSDEETHIAYLYYYERQIIASLCIISAVAGAVGNCLVILAMFKSKKLRTVTNVFVTNLSVSDLLSSIFLPWEAVALLGEGAWPSPRTEWICVTSTAVLCLSYGSSFNNLTLIALNRWIGITKSKATTRRIYTRRNIAFMLVFSWAFPLSLVLIPLVSDFGELGYEPLYSVCGFVRSNSYSVAYCFVFSMCFSPIQFLILLLCYTSVFRYVRKKSRTMARLEIHSVSGAVCTPERVFRRRLWKRQIAVTKNLVYIVSAFVICQLPFVIAISRQSLAWGIRMTMYGAAILFFNSSVNPVIYAVSHPDFKETFNHMFRRK